MAVVKDDQQCGEMGFKPNGQFKHGLVPERSLFEGAEPAMNCGQFADACAIDTLDSANPELQIRVNRVFDHDRNVHTLEGICYFLYGKWIDRCPGADPENVNACFQCFFYMAGGGYLNRYRQQVRSEEHTSDLQSIMRISHAV